MKKKLGSLKDALLRKKQPLVTSALLACVLVGYQNCQTKEEFFSKDELVTEIAPGGNTIKTPGEHSNSTPLCKNGSSNDLICNPLGGGGTLPDEPPAVTPGRLGLIASLYEGQSQWNSIDQYFSEGYKHPENIYFSNFNVPIRSFSDGFGYAADDFLKNKSGEKLIEWFAVEAKGHITLPEQEEGGFYHIMTLSDDGIQINVNGKLILSNPNTHAPRIDCATELVELRKGEEKDFRLAYFQGPRFYIALMTFIKKIDDPAAFKRSKLCSVSNDPSEVLGEGYKIMSPSWFTLPDGF